jgi:hypothetical protein
MTRVSLQDGHAKIIGVVELSSVDDLAEVMSGEHAWIAGTFRNGHRNLEGLDAVHVMALDVDDGGVPIEECVRRLDASGLGYVVGASRHHRLAKDGKPACDRYRPAVLLSEPIVSREAYDRTRAWLIEHLGLTGHVDPNAADPSRYWNPCRSDVGYVKDGERLEVLGHNAGGFRSASSTLGHKEIRDPPAYAAARIEQLARTTPGAGERQKNVFKAATDIGRVLKTGQVNEQEVVTVLTEAALATGLEPDRVDDAIRRGLANGYAAQRGPAVAPAPDVWGVPLEEFLALDIPKPKTLTWKLTASQLAVLYGGANSSKTWLAMELSRQASQAGSPVLYFAQEGHPAFLHERFKTLLSGRSRYRLSVRQGFCLMEPEHVDRLIHTAKADGSELIIIDPLLDSVNGLDLNDTPTVTPLVQTLLRIRDETEACLLVIHHSSKFGMRGEQGFHMDNFLGSTYLRNAPDLMIEVRRVDGLVGISEVAATKNRNGPQEYGCMLQLFVDGPDVRDVAFFPGSDGADMLATMKGEAKARRKDERKDERHAEQDADVLEALRKGGGDRSIRWLAGETSKSERTVSESLARLSDANAVVKRGSTWHVC